MAETAKKQETLEIRILKPCAGKGLGYIVGQRYNADKKQAQSLIDDGLAMEESKYQKALESKNKTKGKEE